MRLKELRKANKETQKQLADFLDVSLRTVQNYESGNVTIPNAMLKKLSVHYNVPVSDIFVSKEDIEINLDDIDKSTIAVYIVNNWEEMMKDNLFEANFKAKAGEWALKIKKSM
ncbi:helix-turn-helix domain-containing protein [Tenacibaculum aiptasiae]|uniref:helix-turn-helix domain-containing protein n=1 Tax=Tenacibaculum aiptasiae TaxID=426481 RepID=UPI00232FF038|nr:helix-turn-helix transcriptional regulator [Tenacibaculum aiptasiae]